MLKRVQKIDAREQHKLNCECDSLGMETGIQLNDHCRVFFSIDQSAFEPVLHVLAGKTD